ncbi:MAG: PDZ domain-containing protein [Phycisphaerae bacterium]|nr:PDZ domain-containing protein [Phycisphaerae bacterium]
MSPRTRALIVPFLAASPLLAACVVAAGDPQPPPPPPPPTPASGGVQERRVAERLEVTVDIENGGPPRVVVNGETVPQERLERMPDGSIRVRSADGSRVLHVIPPVGPAADALQEVRPMIGVMLGAVDPLLARHLHLDPDSTSVIVGVRPGSPAAEAGLVEGDLLVGIEGGPATMERLQRMTMEKKEVDLKVIHEGEKRSLRVAPRLMAVPVARDAGPMPAGVDEGMREGVPWGMPGMPRQDAPPPGSWEDMRGALERLRDRTSDEIRSRLDEWRDRWEGPWAEEHVRRPMREMRESARREFERLVDELESRERRMQERLEERLQRFGEEMREQSERLRRELREAWSRENGSRENGSRENGSREGRPREDRPREGGPRPDGPRPDQPRQEGPGPERPRPQGPGGEGPRPLPPAPVN